MPGSPALRAHVSKLAGCSFIILFIIVTVTEALSPGALAWERAVLQLLRSARQPRRQALLPLPHS